MGKGGVIIVILILIVAAAAVYFTSFYIRKCPDKSCFESAQAKCERRSYVSEAKEGFWEYKIKGKSGENCRINVKLLQLKEGAAGMSSLEGKEMLCELPLGFVAEPQNNLGRCHGLLKEEMQTLIINKLHNYITENLGEISEELVGEQIKAAETANKTTNTTSITASTANRTANSS